jgi:hypothetical protein
MQIEAKSMPKYDLILTNHARLRMAQRNVSGADISYIIRYGEEVHRAGAVLVTLRQRDIPKEERPNPILTRLEGVTVVLSRDESIILTVWRNRRQGSKRIRNKAKYGRKSGCESVNKWL